MVILSAVIIILTSCIILSVYLTFILPSPKTPAVLLRFYKCKTARVHTANVYMPIGFSILHLFSPEKFLVFFLLSVGVLVYLIRKHSLRTDRLRLDIQELKEKTNLLIDYNFKERKTKVSLQGKIGRYNGLKTIIEEINKNQSLDYVCEYLVSVVFSTIGKDRGICILYLFNNQSQKLSIFKVRKEDKKLIIKTKEGDIFDFWVLRHMHPLLVEDIRRDFRFDLERIEAEKERTFSSLISAPFTSEHGFIGLLRLDNERVSFFSQDDLRLLVAICDLGAVAIENAQLFLRTQELAIRDGLTSLYRKGYFLDRLKEECKRSARLDKTFSLLMLDIDHFKDFNDKYGHTAGDIVLREISQNLTDLLKEKSAFISRFGGEEFCVILSGVELSSARNISEKIRKRIASKKINLRGEDVSVTVSIGIVNFPKHERDETELIIKADKAMYEAKEKGRNRIAVASYQATHK